ncbi:MAG TPA: YCF48-related protein [Chloroflexota bacterium]|nr:YCF48-related protein [Chloroflexota bacterium]
MRRVNGIRILIGALLILPAVSAGQADAGGTTSAAGRWLAQKSPTSTNLLDVSCASISECVAVGRDATIIKTVNAGRSWTVLKSAYGIAHPAASFTSVRCAVSGVCSIVSPPNLVLHTSNGGRTWQTATLALPATLSGLGHVACPTRLVCWVTASPAGDAETWFDHSGAVFKSSDGSKTWRQEAIPPTTPCDGDCKNVGYDLQWISCQTGQHCFAGGSTFIDSHTGYANAMIRTANGGSSWSSALPCHEAPCQSFAPTTATCPTVTICTGIYYAPYSVDTGPDLGRTTSGGKTWSITPLRTVLTAVACSGKSFCAFVGLRGAVADAHGTSLTDDLSPTTRTLNAVACPSAATCYGVGNHGVIITRHG